MSAIDRIRKKRELLEIQKSGGSQLDVSKKRIEQHRNDIATTGKIDYGTTANFTLPVKSNSSKTIKTTSKKDEVDLPWYKQIFTKGEFEDGVDGFGDFLSKTAKTTLGTSTDALRGVAKGILKPAEDLLDIVQNINATKYDLLGMDELAKTHRKIADKDLIGTATKAVANVTPTGMVYNLLNGTPEKILNPYGVSYDKDKSVLENIENRVKTVFSEEKEPEAYEKSSVLGNTADKVTEGVGYVLSLMYGGQALSAATGTGKIGIATKAGKTALGASASGGNIGLTVAGKTLNIPTLALAGGMASGLQEANSKEDVTEAERWGKALSSGAIEGISEGLFGMFGVGGITDDAGKELFDVLGGKAASLFTSRAGKMLANIGLKSTGETAEEFVSYTLNYLSDNNLIDKLGKADFSKTWDWGEVGETLALSFATSMITQGGGNIIQNNAAVAQAEQQLGRKLTKQEKADITQAAIEGTVQNKIAQIEQKVATNEQTQIQPANTTHTVEEIDNQIVALEEQLSSDISDAEYDRITNQIKMLEEQADQLEQSRPTTTQEVESNSLVEASSNTLNTGNNQENILPVIAEQIKQEQLGNTLPIVPERQNQANEENALPVLAEQIKQEQTTQSPVNKKNIPVKSGRQSTLVNATNTQSNTQVVDNQKVINNTNETTEEVSQDEDILPETQEERKISKEWTEKVNEQDRVNRPLAIEQAKKTGKNTMVGYSPILSNNKLYSKGSLSWVTPDGKLNSKVVAETEIDEFLSKNKIDKLENGINTFENGLENKLPLTKENKNETSENDKSPLVMTEEEYLGSKGYSFMGYAEAGLHNSSQHVSKRGKKDSVNYVHNKAIDYDTKREELRKEYQEKVASGEIRKPTLIEQSLKTAHGMDENPAVQAARRNLARRGIDWRTGEKIPSEVQEDLAPIKEATKELKQAQKAMSKEVKEIKKELAPIKEMIEDVKALTEKDLPMLEQLVKDSYNNIENLDIPTRNNLTQEESNRADNIEMLDRAGLADVEELSEYNDLRNKELNNPDVTEESTRPTESPLEKRDIDEVGKNRKINAYQYEHPEFRPYFQKEAQHMLYDLKNSTKGERIITGDTSQFGSANDQQWVGIKRQTTDDIAYLRDNYKYTTEDLEKGLEAIIKDHGAENYAVAKRIEIMLDERLREGYTDVDGYEIPANQDYLDFLEENNWNDYYSSINPDIDVIPYTAQEIENYKNGKVKVAQNANDIDTFVETATKTSNNNKLYFGKIGEIVANKIKNVLGIDLTNYNISLKNDAIRHTLNHHSTEAEILRGQIPITLDDFKLIPEIISSYDSVKQSGTTEQGKPAITFEKQIGDTYYLVNYVSDKNHTLEVQTMFKHKKKNSATGDNTLKSPIQTSETDSGTSSSIKYISQNENNVNLPIREDYEAIRPQSENKTSGRMLRVKPQSGVLTEGPAKPIDYELPTRTEQTNLVGDPESKNLPSRKEVTQKYQAKAIKTFAEKGFNIEEVFNNAKSKSTFSSVDNTPERFTEKTLGFKEGKIFNELTTYQVAKNESEGIKWLNSFTNRKDGFIAKISKEYNIKPRSKESAAAQMYGEGFFTDEKGERFAYGDKQLELDFPNATVRENIKKLAKDPRIRKLYDDTLKRINESRTRNGYKEIPRLDNYFLHYRAMEDTFSQIGIPFNPNDIRAKDLPTDLNGVTADLKPGQPYFASAQHRTGFKTTYDLLGGLERYLGSAKNQIFHIDDIQMYRAMRNMIADTYGQAKGLEDIDMLTEEEQEARIKYVYDAHLSNFAKFLNEQANVIAGKTSLMDRGVEGIIGRRGIQFIDSLNRQVGANMIAFNASPAFTNLISTVQAVSKTNKASALKGFAQLTFNRINKIFGKTDGFYENDPTAIRRQGIENFTRTPWQKVQDVGYSLMGGIDNLSTEFILRSKYNELVDKKGMSHEDAQREAGRFAMRILGDRSLGQMPQMFNSKIANTILKFQLEVRNQLDSQFYDTFREAEISTEDVNNKLERNAKKATRIASTLVQLAVFQHLFGKAFEEIAGYNPAFDIISAIMKVAGFDDDEESEDTLTDNIWQGINEFAGDLPYVSTLTGGGRIPIGEALPIEELFSGKDEFGNEKSRLETLGEALPYYVLPGGYSQYKKTTQGLSMYDEDLPLPGSYTDSGNLRFTVEDTTKNRIQSAVFGQWSSDEARKYIDSEFKTISKNNIDELKALEMTASEYRKLKSDITAAGKTNQEKVDYITSIEGLNDYQKNVLINNILDRDYDVDASNYSDFSSYEEFDYSYKNPEKYNWLKDNNISYREYTSSDESKEMYDYAYKNPDKYNLGVAATNDFKSYYSYKQHINDLYADKDSDGNSISGTRKNKVISYVNSLDLSIPQKAMIIRTEYSSFDIYNNDIVSYVDGLDIDYSVKVEILESLEMKVYEDGSVGW